MARLSEETLALIEQWPAKGGTVPMPSATGNELIRGYRRAAALEDMLREWIADLDLDYCCDIPGGGHRESCLVGRTAALLAEGDESPATFAVRFERGQWARIDAALEDMLREWVGHTGNLHARYQDEPCADCIEFAERSEALLAEGDE